ncbi:cytochrome b5-like heme/steroid binding domain-containing protein [Aspergillus recurvatus]
MSNNPGTETQPSLVAAIVDPATPPSSSGSKPDATPVTIDKVYTKDELLVHNKDGNLWLAIDGTVYDLTKFSEEHPGGKKILLGVAGTDASKKYRKYHGDNILQRYAQEYRIGTLRGEMKESGRLFSMFKKRK